MPVAVTCDSAERLSENPGRCNQQGRGDAECNTGRQVRQKFCPWMENEAAGDEYRDNGNSDGNMGHGRGHDGKLGQAGSRSKSICGERLAGARRKGPSGTGRGILNGP